jgi:hypothetical protein
MRGGGSGLTGLNGPPLNEAFSRLIRNGLANKWDSRTPSSPPPCPHQSPTGGHWDWQDAILPRPSSPGSAHSSPQQQQPACLEKFEINLSRGCVHRDRSTEYQVIARCEEEGVRKLSYLNHKFLVFRMVQPHPPPPVPVEILSSVTQTCQTLPSFTGPSFCRKFHSSRVNSLYLKIKLFCSPTIFQVPIEDKTKFHCTKWKHYDYLFSHTASCVTASEVLWLKVTVSSDYTAGKWY